MIKKLRRRFIIVNMSILTCVLFGVLTGIFAYMYSSEVRISYELIESILNEKDINFNKPDKIMESAENETVTENGGFLAQMSYISQNNNQKNEGGDFNWDRNEQYTPFPEDPFVPDPYPEKKPDPTSPEKPDNSNPDKEDPDSSENDFEDDEENDDNNDESENDDSSSRTDNAVNINPHLPAEDSVKEGNNDSFQQESAVTQSTYTTSADKASSESRTTVIVTTEKKESQPPKLEFPDPYRGNVKRAYIMVQYNQNDDIDRIVYQYLDDADEEDIEEAAIRIYNDKSDRGKLTIGDYKLRYMKKDNPRMIGGGCRIVFLDRTLEISTINRMLFIFIIIGSVGVIIIFGISVLLANWTIKPVDKAWQQQKQFVADASHELKTPLTVISANTDVILSNENETVKSQSKWLNYIKEETKRMTKLVNSMLYIAKYDSDEMKLAADRFSLSEVMSSICLQFESIIYESGKLLETDIEDNIYFKGDEDKIKQLVNILLDNAHKYSTENGRITARLSEDQKTGKISLSVANTSNYIEPDKMNKLFDRFYRLDCSRNRKTGGSGLGLNIAKSIVEAHGGSIKAFHENGITCFTVIL